MRIMAFLAGLAALSTLGCAMPPGPPPPGYFAQSSGPACFRANQVLGYSQGPDGYVDLQTAQGPFRLRLDASCPNFSWIMQIGVRPVEDSWLCAGRPDELITAYQTQFGRCEVREIEPLAGPMT